MKFLVDKMPYYKEDCPFCDSEYEQKAVCMISPNSSYYCDYMNNNVAGERDPEDCRYLIALGDVKDDAIE